MDTSSSVPPAIARVIKAMGTEVLRQDQERTRQLTIFQYQDFPIAQFVGPLPIPAVGQNVAIWDRYNDPIVVEDVTIHYGLTVDGTQIATAYISVVPAT